MGDVTKMSYHDSHKCYYGKQYVSGSVGFQTNSQQYNSVELKNNLFDDLCKDKCLILYILKIYPLLIKKHI